MDIGAWLGRADKLRIVRVGVVLAVLVAVPVVAFIPGPDLLVRAAFLSGLACGFLIGALVMRWAR